MYSRDQIAEIIRREALARAIDPEVALAVWKTEGYGGVGPNYKTRIPGEESYGPYQLYLGGGLGNKFMRDTGLDPRDPSSIPQQVAYALDTAAQDKNWNHWYGPRDAGIMGWANAGLSGAKPTGSWSAADPDNYYGSDSYPGNFGGGDNYYSSDTYAGDFTMPQPDTGLDSWAGMRGEPSAAGLLSGIFSKKNRNKAGSLLNSAAQSMASAEVPYWSTFTPQQSMPSVSAPIVQPIRRG